MVGMWIAVDGAISSICSWMCSEEPMFVVKSSPPKQPDLRNPRRGRRSQNVQGKVPHINSKPKLTVYHNFYLFIPRNEQERSVLSPRFDEPHSFTYFAMQRKSVWAEVKPSPCKNVPWTSQYTDWYVYHLHRWTDSRSNWRQLQRGILRKSCAKVEATSDQQNVFLPSRVATTGAIFYPWQPLRLRSCMLMWKCM